MADFSFVTSRLATGAAISGVADVDALMAVGITHIIDCRAEFDDTALFGVRASVLWIGTDDDGQHKPPAWFERGIAFALDALSHHRTKVYAHCAAGVNRGPSMAYAVLRAFGFSPQYAEQLIRAARPHVGLAYKADADAAVIALGWTP